MTQPEAAIAAFDLLCLYLVIRVIAGSAKRWLAIGYAVGGFLLVLLLGFVATLILAPRSGDPNEVNPVLDMIGRAVTYVAPIAAIVGAWQAPEK